jgi:hypothetical protein
MKWIQERGIEQFCGDNEAYGLDFEFEGEGQGVVGLGLQWIQERKTISYHVAKHMDHILDFRV